MGIRRLLPPAAECFCRHGNVCAARFSFIVILYCMATMITARAPDSNRRPKLLCLVWRGIPRIAASLFGGVLMTPSESGGILICALINLAALN
jgi:hypothetical protein